jgi:hypothetical protein
MRYLVLLLTAGIFWNHLTLAQGRISKEEEKFWKEKAKMYAKNPASLKSEFESYQDQIDELKKINKDLDSRLRGAQNTDALDSLRWALVQQESELQALRGQKERLEKSLTSQKKVNELGIRDGLVYRIQIGAYVFYEMPGATSPKSDDFVAEKSDGFNKYIMGGFRTYEEALAFRDEIRKMGIKDAWVVPYIDGVRVTIEEAKEHLAKQGQAQRADR